MTGYIWTVIILFTVGFVSNVGKIIQCNLSYGKITSDREVVELSLSVFLQGFFIVWGLLVVTA